MDLPYKTPDVEMLRAQDRALLAASGLFDEAFYQSQIRLHASVDLLRHYLDLGWQWGLEPRQGFDGAFLAPFYEATGLLGPPLLTWIGLGGFGPRAVQTEAEARHWAEVVRDYPGFDAGYYARQIPQGIDPALHYIVVGESLGWRPSEGFDPGYYMERYPDVAIIGLSPLRHFEQSGRNEQRRPRSATELVGTPAFKPDGRPTILVIAHEASRTGAPILSWHLARDLARHYNIVSVLLNGGQLISDFAAVSKAVVGPLSHAEWNMPDMRRIADRIADTYRPLYAIANSIETHWLVPALAKRGVPSVALIHEFAAYTRPLSKLSNVLDWATDVVFPARIVADSSYSFFPHLKGRRGVHVFAQGRVDPPQRGGGHDAGPVKAPWTQDGRFTVLAAGHVQIRKGTDLFLSIADLVRRIAPEIGFHFVWIGEGYDPLNDPTYSAYLGEQLTRAALEDMVSFVKPVEDLEPAYAASNVFLMCSRLDPQPNVGIDAIVRGLPVVCFEGACGTAEILGRHWMTRELVAPHLDVHAAATIIVDLARDDSRLAAMKEKVAEAGRRFYDMAGYVERVDAMGRAAAARLHGEDRVTLERADVLDVDLMLPLGEVLQGSDGLVCTVLQQWAATGMSENQAPNAQFRRPCAGFHPQAYAAAHAEACGPTGANPVAHWLRGGKPAGPWSREVFGPLQAPAEAKVRVLLHGHFYYPELAYDLVLRLALNATVCDLILTTDTEDKAVALRRAAREHGGTVAVTVLPNRGRNIGPLLDVLRNPATASYEVFGHVHGKRSTATDGDMGDRWRDFLWTNLVGANGAPMLDTVAQVFATRPEVGLMWAEDPHLVGWGANRALAEQLAPRLGITGALPMFFDFPLGAMFYGRPSALRALLLPGIGLDREDLPEEPVAYDGTVLHAVERLLPFLTEGVATVRVPGTTW